MKRVLFALAIMTFLTLTIACQQGKEVASESKVDTQADIQAIKDIVADFNVALNSGDIGNASFHMADEFIVIPPNRPLLNGKDASVRDLQQLFDQFTFKELDVVKDVQINGDLAVTHYTWTCETTPKAGGEPTNDNGNGIIVLRKQPDDIWKFIYLIYSNESLVSPEQPAVFSLPATIGAADPLIGTWKLNVAKSKYPSTQPAPKELTETYREINGGLIDFTYESVQADGTKELFKATWHAEGGTVNISEGQANPGRSYVETLLEPGNWYVTVLQDGKQIATMHKFISKDGKTMTQTSTDVDKDDKPSEILRVYEKQ